MPRLTGARAVPGDRGFRMNMRIATLNIEDSATSLGFGSRSSDFFNEETAQDHRVIRVSRKVERDEKED